MGQDGNGDLIRGLRANWQANRGCYTVEFFLLVAFFHQRGESLSHFLFGADHAQIAERLAEAELEHMLVVQVAVGHDHDQG